MRPEARAWQALVRRVRAALAVGVIAVACSRGTPEPGAARGGLLGEEERSIAVDEPQAARGPAEPGSRGAAWTEPVFDSRDPDPDSPDPDPDSPDPIPDLPDPIPDSPDPDPDSPEPPAASSDSIAAAANALRALEPDPAPAHTTNDLHYLVSNERRLDLFRPELDDLGGVLLGVGTDQNYVMAAWSRTELLVVVDFDQQVVDLHAIHGALMAAAPTVADFRRLWTEPGAPEAHAALRAAHPARPELLALYDDARDVVDRRLRGLARRYAELGIRSWLDTPEQYRFVADLHARGRVVALRGDFTQGGVLRRVAATLGAHALPVKVLYLSNIEQYFAYRRPFKDNMLALPFADDTVVLRTLPGRPAGFHYIVQRGDDFHAWMRAPKVWSVYKLRGMAKGEHLVAGERWVAGPPSTPPAAAG